MPTFNKELEKGDSIVEVSAAPRGRHGRARSRILLIGAAAATIALIIVLASLFAWRRGSQSGKTSIQRAAVNQRSEDRQAGTGEVVLSPETLAAAGLEYEGVSARPAVASLRVTGAVEPNQQQTQQATPLVGGRVEQVNVQLGDAVRAGSVLAVISSPQIAQMHGKLHEAETGYELAERNLRRVQQAENRVAVLQSKARLDEAEATLKRARRLVELGAGAGRDLIHAETAYQTAKAEYEFQSNIALNRELQEARAAVETARVDVSHIRHEMRALGVSIAEGAHDDHSRDTSLVMVRAPVSGIVTERAVNPGAGVEAGTPLFTISNLATVYVIANVPENQIGQLRTGTAAEVRTAALPADVIRGRVSYIAPQLDEATRTARTRVEVPNREGRLRAGMFVEVSFRVNTNGDGGEELMVPIEAVQRIEDKAVVFIPQADAPGRFEVREIQLGGEADNYQRVQSGLKPGERVVTKNSFILKTQLLKGELGEE